MNLPIRAGQIPSALYLPHWPKCSQPAGQSPRPDPASIDRDGLARRARRRRRLRPRRRFACSRVDRRRRRDVPAGPAVVRRQRARAGDACRFGSYNSPKGRMLANSSLWRDAARARRLCHAARGRHRRIASQSGFACTCCARRSPSTDVPPATQRIGVGGPGAAAALRAVLEAVPGAARSSSTSERPRCSALPGGRFVVLAPGDRPTGSLRRPLRDASPRRRDSTSGAGSRSAAGVPVITAATQDAFVAQAANWTCSAASISGRAATPGRKSSRGRSISAGSRNGPYLFHADTLTRRAGDRIYQLGLRRAALRHRRQRRARARRRQRSPRRGANCGGGTGRRAPSCPRRPAARRAAASLCHPGRRERRADASA